MRYMSLIAALTLAGCATSYQPQGITGGYSETMLQPGLVEVRFAGNAYTSEAVIRDFALLRAAEVLAEDGFTHMLYGGQASSYASGWVAGNVAYKKGASVTAKGVPAGTSGAFDIAYLINSLRSKHDLD